MKDPDASFLSTFITPNHAHYVLAHLGIARCEADGWTLAVVGSVGESLSLTLEDIAGLPARRVTVTLACAGDPHHLDLPKRRASTAVWRGVPLADLLALARPAPGASHIWLDGADHGIYKVGTPYEANVDRYRKDISLVKALEPDVLVAYEMNGEPLPAEHGFPLRMIVPGYYGTSSVKWLRQITVATRPAKGLFSSVLYTTNRPGGRPTKQPVAEMVVNSLIIEPRPNAVWDIGQNR
ncbi:MAG: molybdopterin-dependent oxidoreductase, partial [Acidimicrobiales bacterium]